MTGEPIHDLAHIAHAELLHAVPEESLRFFAELFGMEIEHRDGQSVFLRGWGDYQPYGLKLTESELPGLGHIAIRAWSPEALERRVAGDRADRTRHRLERGRPRPRPRLPVHGPRRPRVRALLRERPLRPARAPAPAAEERAPAPRRPRRRGQAARPRQRAGRRTSPPTARFATEQLGFRLYEQIINDDGSEQGAWMSLTIAAHELIYVADHAGGQRPPAPPRLLRRHPRGAAARRRPVPRRRRPDRGRAVQARRRPGDVPVRVRAGRQPRRGHDRHPLHLRPRLRARRAGPRPSAPAARPGA